MCPLARGPCPPRCVVRTPALLSFSVLRRPAVRDMSSVLGCGCDSHTLGEAPVFPTRGLHTRRSNTHTLLLQEDTSIRGRSRDCEPSYGICEQAPSTSASAAGRQAGRRGRRGRQAGRLAHKTEWRLIRLPPSIGLFSPCPREVAGGGATPPKRQKGQARHKQQQDAGTTNSLPSIRGVSRT